MADMTTLDELIDCHLDTFSDLYAPMPTHRDSLVDNKLARFAKAAARSGRCGGSVYRLLRQSCLCGPTGAFAIRISEALAEDSLAQAPPLVEDMENRHGAIIEGVDDSGGGVGMFWPRLQIIWLDIAAGLQ